uniref:response regulator n=1 Tax=Sulfuriferula sp. GW6 TaxID=3345112 RepID=UPI0039F6D407
MTVTELSAFKMAEHVPGDPAVGDLLNHLGDRCYRALVEQMNEGAVTLNLDGLILFANGQFANWLGADVSALPGLRFSSLLKDGEVVAFERLFDQVRIQPVKGEFHLQRGRSTEFVPVLVSLSPFEVDGIPLIAGVVTDLTDRKRVEEALGETKRLAEEAAKTKSDFLANMSHEIRTPMNAIIGMTHLVLQSELTAKQRNYLEKVDNAARGLLGIINDILDFSKIEANKLRFEHVDFDLGEVMQHLADLSILKAQEKGLELLFDIPPDLPAALVGDPLRLSQVLVNLVNNAIKFTEAGEVMVSVSLRERTDRRGLLRFAIRDTGIGLDPPALANLFQPFTQADTSTTRKYGGSGLGLTICKHLVEMMGGQIQVDSAPGRGSLFSFTAWFDLQAEGNQALTPPVDVLGMRILVVDDNASARQIFVSILESMCFEVCAVASASKAISELVRALAAQRPYQIVLMDWMMPDMDGLEAIRLIRSDARLAMVPACVMVTAYSRDELLQRAQDKGVKIDGVLIKPVSPSTLLDALMEAVGRSAPPTRRARKISADAAAAHAIKGLRVLLVEDNAFNQEMVRDLLEDVGVIVATADNGRLALQALETAGPFDAVLMDIQMPEMDGYTATRQIRASAHAAVKIIALTANAMTEDREACLAAGMDDFVAKPVDPGHLYHTLLQCVGRQPALDARKSGGDAPTNEPAVASSSPAVGQAQPPAGGRLVDLSNLAEAVRHNPQRLRKHALKFLDVARSTSEEMQAALARGDLVALAALGHKLKSSARTVGAPELARLCEELERAGRANDAARVAEILSALPSHVVNIDIEIRSRLDAGTEPPENPLR